MELLQCLGAPGFSAYIISAALFVFAYILYRVFLAIFRKIFSQDGLWRCLIEALRFPVVAIFWEVAAIISINILGVKGVYERLLLIVVIATIGWLIASITRGLYRYFMEKYESVSSIDKEERTMVTQILFLYRLVMFLVFVITFASILMTFPHIKSVGIGLLSSAGIAGIALGMAARPILLNLIAGFQIAMTKTIKIGDAVIVEGDFARIETIHLTHVVARTWDLRRIVLPISYFIDKPFQNWDAKDPELLGSVFIHCDYSAPLEKIRKKLDDLVCDHPSWNKKLCKMHVTNCTDKTIELRLIMSANDASSAFELRCFVREKLVEFLQKEHPHALPCMRYNKVL